MKLINDQKTNPIPNQTEDQWLLPEPRTPEQLTACREEQLTIAAELLKNPPQQFTCDGCGLVGVCKLAFDSYNTNGDCLYDK